MNFSEILQNRILIVAALCWCVAGVFKTIIELIVNKKLDIKRIFGAGGMPSSHTSTVTGLTIATLWYEGISSSSFAIAVILSIIVIHDAMNVRLETGKQAHILNELLFNNDAFKELDFNQQLKEYIGHTPFQVIVGIIVGIITSLICIRML